MSMKREESPKRQDLSCNWQFRRKHPGKYVQAGRPDVPEIDALKG